MSPLTKKVITKAQIEEGRASYRPHQGETYDEFIAKMETWHNNLYIVSFIREYQGQKNKTSMFEMNVFRKDRQPIFDWRHIQLIKNQIVGDEFEMVQLFPAESRLMDTANQYWFYGFSDPKEKFPFGYDSRTVSGPETGLPQRAFED